jgi:LDH2 family malate/lactate/ureidoglycolate dehydrogenase
MVFKPDVFLDSIEEYIERTDTLSAKIRACEKAAGVERIYVSREIEHLMGEKRRGKGIPHTRGELDALHKLATDVGSEVRLI